MDSLLTLIIFVPVVAALQLLFVPAHRVNSFRWSALIATVVQLALSIVMWVQFDGKTAPDSPEMAFQLVERLPWIRLDLPEIGVLNVDYFVGVDGISAPLVVLSSLILVIGVISSWNISEKPKGYFILYLILGASVVGCFVALDFFLFYLFFEFMLLPMFFLIGIWGGDRRQYASIKFFLYTLVGSLLILVVMIGLYLSVEENGQNTFSFLQILNKSAYGAEGFLGWNENWLLGMSAREWAFWFLLIGFAIKLPMVPFHTWLPDAHVEAPTPISVILAGLLLKIGGYGLLRIAIGFFPDVAIESAFIIGILGLISIIYGGMNAMAQDDLKRLVAYSSVSHMGFVLLGFAAMSTQGFSGGVFQMVSHGLLSPALFLLVGVIYDRTANRQIENFSGLGEKLPKYTVFAGLFFFASLGLPGLSGFIGELLVLMGSIGSEFLPRWIGVVAITGILISAAYFLWTIQRMFFGEYWVRKAEWQEKMLDLNKRELLMLIPLGLLVIALGVFPKIILGPIQNSIDFWANYFIEFAK